MYIFSITNEGSAWDVHDRAPDGRRISKERWLRKVEGYLQNNDFR
jgi:hypothetical protein